MYNPAMRMLLGTLSKQIAILLISINFGASMASAAGKTEDADIIGDPGTDLVLDLKSEIGLSDCLGQMKWLYTKLNLYTFDEIKNAITTDPVSQNINEECGGEKADYFHGIDFINDLEGWVAGWNGKILHTSNGGVTWTPQTSGTSTHFRSIDFVDANYGWAVGHDGLVVHTNNGGRSWKRQAVLGDVQLWKISCVTRQKCWIGSQFLGFIFATSDGGKSWLKQRTKHKGRVTSVFFLDENSGWAVTNLSEILNTSDGGKTWNLQSLADKAMLYDIHFSSKIFGWAVGDDGLLFQTTDGGQSWQKKSHLLTPLYDKFGPGDMDFRAVRFVDPVQGWAAGLNGLIVATRDGGKNWFVQAYEANSIYSIYAISYFSAQRVWASGNMGHIFATIDGGANWKAIHGLEYLLSRRALTVLTEKDEQVFMSGADLFGKQQFARARKTWEQAAKHGHAMAAFELAKLYTDGRGGPVNPKEATRMLTIAAEGNIADAQLHLAVRFGKGVGIARSLQEEIQWYMIVLENETATDDQKVQATEALANLKAEHDSNWFESMWSGAKIGARLWREKLQLRQLPFP